MSIPPEQPPENLPATESAADMIRQAEFPLAVRDRTSYRSDQWAFLERRVPALLFTTGLHDQYHRPGDVPELIEVDAALRVVAVVEQLVAGLADGARPKFVADDGK